MLVVRGKVHCSLIVQHLLELFHGGVIVHSLQLHHASTLQGAHSQLQPPNSRPIPLSTHSDVRKLV